MPNKDDFVIGVADKRVALIKEVERRTDLEDVTCDLSRYTLQYVDGSTLSNAPGYLYREATEEEVVEALRAAGKHELEVMIPSHLLPEESREIVDRLMGEFLFSCIGKNDMAVATGLLTAAAILIVTHCEKTGDDVGELMNQGREIFELAGEITQDHAVKK